MTRDDLLPTLLTVCRDVLDDDEIVFDAQTPFEAIEEWDSLNHIHMVVNMEKIFDVRFEAAELQNLIIVQDLLDCIARLKGL